MENNTSKIATDATPDANSDTTADGKVKNTQAPTPEEYRKSLELRKLEIDVAKGEMDLDNLLSLIHI